MLYNNDDDDILTTVRIISYPVISRRHVLDVHCIRIRGKHDGSLFNGSSVPSFHDANDAQRECLAILLSHTCILSGAH